MAVMTRDIQRMHDVDATGRVVGDPITYAPTNQLLRGTAPGFLPSAPKVAADPSDPNTWSRRRPRVFPGTGDM